MTTSSLTRSVGLRVGPIVLGTLVKHYIDKVKRDFVQTDGSKGKEKNELVQLRQDELIYDEIFTVVKAFLEAATFHSVEDIQSFSNTRTPSPPWVHVVRVRVPMSSCDEAAKYLITALGGEETAVRVVGGVKWWQVRSLDGVDAQWITAKKDWQEAKRRYRDKEKTQREGKHEGTENESATYNQDMDMMRCILYAHGGGYYFGSVDQERYSIQRYARKINGRVFAINYRLAPQYPFPCAIQDLLAAYIYLIRPPPEASHMPVKPSHIVVAGDSAGGGLTLALLQVLRDASLPLPAGGVLISPWCDLTHSFPSIHTNTTTDVIPPYGLSLHKPSTLWPPPDEELAGRMRKGLRQRVRAVFKSDPDPNASVLTLGGSTLDPNISTTASTDANSTPPGSGDVPSNMPINVGATTPLPAPNSSSYNANTLDPNSAHESVVFQAQNGEILSIQQQIQLYTTNALLGHPLVSPALGYLGGLPPLLVIVSDKEVLRDEGIYLAHKAAHPEQFPIRDATRALYPALDGIEERFRDKPTPVHLQVYDDTAHVLPVLFSFTTPAKYCFRAMAIFCKYVTGMPLFPSDTTQSSSQKTMGESSSAGVLSSLSSSITSALAQSGTGTDTPDAAASPPTSPTSPRSIKSFTINGNSIFSIRNKSRKSTGVGSSDSDLKRSASEYQTGEFGQIKHKTSWMTVRSRKSGSNIGRSTDGPKDGTQAVTESELNKPESRIFSRRKKVDAPPSLQLLPLSDPSSSSSPEHPSLSAQLAPSPLQLSDTSSASGLDTSHAHLTVSTTTSSNSSLIISQSTVIDAKRLTESPTTSTMPSPPFMPTLASDSDTLDKIEGLPSSTTVDDTMSPLVDASSPLRVPLPPSPLKSKDSIVSSSSSAPQMAAPSDARQNTERYAGDPIIYSESAEYPSLFTSLMIRERVSTRGVIRPLEPPSDLPALCIPPQLVGEISERAVRRYIEGRTLFDHKFSGTRKAIEQRRRKHLKKARQDTTKNMSALKGSVERERRRMRQETDSEDEERDTSPSHSPTRAPGSTPFNIETALLASSGWSWSWALDQNEHPPPSSLVARRDTHEALMLARIADQAVLQDEQGGVMSANNLWSVIVGFLTPTGSGNGSGIRKSSGVGGPERDKGGQHVQTSPNHSKEKASPEGGNPSLNMTKISMAKIFSSSFSPKWTFSPSKREDVQP